MDSKHTVTAEAHSWASARKLSGWLAVTFFIITLLSGLLLKAAAPLSWSLFLIAFGVYAILVSKGYKPLVTDTQLQGKRARIISILDTVIGIMFLSLGILSLVVFSIIAFWSFLLSN